MNVTLRNGRPMESPAAIGRSNSIIGAFPSRHVGNTWSTNGSGRGERDTHERGGRAAPEQIDAGPAGQAFRFGRSPAFHRECLGKSGRGPTPVPKKGWWEVRLQRQKWAKQKTCVRGIGKGNQRPWVGWGLVLVAALAHLHRVVPPGFPGDPPEPREQFPPLHRSSRAIGMPRPMGNPSHLTILHRPICLPSAPSPHCIRRFIAARAMSFRYN